MALDQDTKDFIINSNKLLYKETVDQINTILVKPLNEKFDYVYKRFDDVERRLEKIESQLNIVGKDTKIIPKIFIMLESDGVDIAKLATRMDKLDK